METLHLKYKLFTQNTQDIGPATSEVALEQKLDLRIKQESRDQMTIEVDDEEEEDSE